MDQLPGSDSLAAAPPQTDIDKMFTGLGLDHFSFNNKAPERPPAPPPGADSGGALSIEDKQR